MSIRKVCCLFLSVLPLVLQAQCPPHSVDVFIAPNTNSVYFQIPALNTLGSPITNTYKLNYLDGIKAGVIGTLFVSHHWFLKGMVDYGWIGSGTYNFSDPNTSVSGQTNGNVFDASIVAGRIYNLIWDIRLAPLVGWQYNKIQAFTSHSLTGSALDFQQIKTQWGGPFIGIDGDYRLGSCWILFAGYECHLAVAQFRMNTPTGSLVQTTRGHIRNLIGNVAHVGASYEIDKTWHVGLDLRMSTYSGTKAGTINPTGELGIYTKGHVNNNISISTTEARLFAGVKF